VDTPLILVLGVGNLLMSDEGAGVHLINMLERGFTFSANVRLLDGGTLGVRLLDPISQSSFLIVADVAVRGKPPGTVCRLTLDDVRSAVGIAAKNSMHQVSFTETLALAEMMEILPPTVIVAIEPQDIQTLRTELTPAVAEKMNDLAGQILKEIKAAGGSFRMK
jgi:hydrogenase maturation protease